MDSVRWFFGDGGTSTLWNPTHVYAATGSYHVYVRVYSYCGGDVTGKDIEIICPAIVAPAFTDAGGMTKTFTYTASATGADSVRWRFGDGGTSTAWNPTHTYAANGVYTVCVTVWNWCRRDSLCDTVHVSGLGVAGLEQASWRVLPNPANDYLEVQAAAGALLQVYDLPGRAVLEAQVTSNNEHYDISHLAAGTYIIQLTGSGHRQVMRLVKE
jgi:PKD repeat protein